MRKYHLSSNQSLPILDSGFRAFLMLTETDTKENELTENELLPVVEPVFLTDNDIDEISDEVIVLQTKEAI